MKTTIALAGAMDQAKEEIYDEVDKLVASLQPATPLKTSQLNNLVSTAFASTELTAAAVFVKNQASREGRTLAGWRDQAGGRQLSDVIADYVAKKSLEKAKVIAEEANLADGLSEKERKQQGREIALEVVRSYVATFAILYRYRHPSKG